MEQLINLHITIFGIEPIIIGMFWEDNNVEIDNIINAIEEGKPYNEYEMLTKEEQISFDKGELLF